MIPNDNQAHAEDICERCGGPNIVWFVESPLWNKHTPDASIICPICFVKAAESQGFIPTAWVIAPEKLDAAVLAALVGPALQKG
jgi:hypothetical protein